MDVFFAYMFVASATPLFLWLEHRKIAWLSIPFIFVMWILAFAFLFDGFLFNIAQSTLVTAVIVNVLIAHVAALVLYGYPHIRARAKRYSKTSE